MGTRFLPPPFPESLTCEISSTLFISGGWVAITLQTPLETISRLVRFEFALANPASRNRQWLPRCHTDRDRDTPPAVDRRSCRTVAVMACSIPGTWLAKGSLEPADPRTGYRTG